MGARPSQPGCGEGGSRRAAAGGAREGGPGDPRPRLRRALLPGGIIERRGPGPALAAEARPERGARAAAPGPRPRLCPPPPATRRPWSAPRRRAGSRFRCCCSAASRCWRPEVGASRVRRPHLGSPAPRPRASCEFRNHGDSESVRCPAWRPRTVTAEAPATTSPPPRPAPVLISSPAWGLVSKPDSPTSQTHAPTPILANPAGSGGPTLGPGGSGALAGLGAAGWGLPSPGRLDLALEAPSGIFPHRFPPPPPGRGCCTQLADVKIEPVGWEAVISPGDTGSPGIGAGEEDTRKPGSSLEVLGAIAGRIEGMRTWHFLAASLLGQRTQGSGSAGLGAQRGLRTGHFRQWQGGWSFQ